MTTVETKRLSQKISGKVIQTDYDFILEQTGACWYCLTDAQVQMILSIVDFFGWSTRWYSESGTIDQQTINELKGGLVDALMNNCCDDDGTIFRFTTDGKYQSSVDGGVTWVDAPQSDPRASQPVYPPFLPPGATGAQCTYADGLKEYIKQGLVDQMEESQTVAEIMSNIIGLLAGIGAALTPTIIGPIVFAILGALIAYIVAHSVDTFKAAFTDDVWNRLKCNIKKNISSDGTVTQANLDAIYAKIGTDETGVTALFLRAVVASMGPILMTNAARQGMGDPDADCSVCDEFCGDDWFWDQEGAIITYNSDDKTVTVESVNGGAFYYMALQGDHCCSMVAEVTTGAISHFFGRWNSCEDFTPDYAHEDNPEWTSTAFGSLTGTGSAIFGRSVTPFTVTITFAT